MVKEPFILELSTDEFIIISYHLHQAIEKLATDVAFFERFAKLSKDKEEKKWRTKHWKSQRRSLKEARKVSEDLETQKNKTLFNK